MKKNQESIPDYKSIYRDMKRTIRYHRNYTYRSCLFFLAMQYSIPVISGVATALIGSGFLGKPSEQQVIVLGIIITALGTLNSVVKPAESYDWAAYFSNRFEEFDNELNLEMTEIETLGNADIKKFLDCLRQKNRELAELINQSNKKQVALFREVLPDAQPSTRENNSTS
jgi:hypothetical protein